MCWIEMERFVCGRTERPEEATELEAIEMPGVTAGDVPTMGVFDVFVQIVHV